MAASSRFGCILGIVCQIWCWTKQNESQWITYQFAANNVPILSISFEMRIFHQSIVFKDSFPIFVVLSIIRILSCELLDADLVAVKVLKNEIAEVSGLCFLSKLNIDVGKTRSRGLGCCLAWNVTVGLHDREFIFIRRARLDASYEPCSRCDSVHFKLKF